MSVSSISPAKAKQFQYQYYHTLHLYIYLINHFAPKKRLKPQHSCRQPALSAAEVDTSPATLLGTPEDSENVAFTLKTPSNVLPSTPRPRNLKTQQWPWPFWICGRGNLVREIPIFIVTPSFSKSSIFKLFSTHTKNLNSPSSWRIQSINQSVSRLIYLVSTLSCKLLFAIQN